jgi:hypothetical protein
MDCGGKDESSSTVAPELSWLLLIQTPAQANRSAGSVFKREIYPTFYQLREGLSIDSVACITNVSFGAGDRQPRLIVCAKRRSRAPKCRFR